MTEPAAKAKAKTNPGPKAKAARAGSPAAPIDADKTAELPRIPRVAYCKFNLLGTCQKGDNEDHTTQFPHLSQAELDKANADRKKKVDAQLAEQKKKASNP